MAENAQSKMTLDLQLSDRELFMVGLIVAHWGTIEHEVFVQTLLTFDDSQTKAADLPKAMKNLQFTQVLALWKERVVDKSKGKRAAVLSDVYKQLLALKESRDALIHGMWQWSPEHLDRISTVRVRKHEVKTLHFDFEYLQSLALRLAELNFSIHYPRGLVDLAAARQNIDFYISRKGLWLMTDPEKERDGQ